MRLITHGWRLNRIKLTIETVILSGSCPGAIMKPTPPLVLVFAASDPTGGAGVQADLLTLSALGCHPLSAITALTIQDTRGVDDVLPMDAEWVADQARMVLEDMRVDAFKLGMLGSVEAIAAIAEVLSDYPDVPVVFDPVLASGAGDELANEEMISAMKEMLLPQTTVLTPNSTEVRRLAWLDEDEDELSLEHAAARLLGYGCEYVFVTGTHENTPRVLNTLYAEQGVVRQDAWDRLSGSYHGSGCTLASALAAGLAFGHDVSEAAWEAQEFVHESLKAAFRPGMGQYIPQRFFWARGPDPEGSA